MRVWSESAYAGDIGFAGDGERGGGVAAVLEARQDGGDEEGRGREGGEAEREVRWRRRGGGVELGT